MEKKTLSVYLKTNKNSIDTLLGKISNLKQIGEGGNGLVYEGNLHGKTIAIKFLINNNSTKLTRFKAEYFNINTLQPNEHIVKYLNFEELHIGEEVVQMIIMNKYDYSLKKYRENLKNPSLNDLIALFDFLINSINFIHSNGIIHRDLKPENILVLETSDTKNITFVLADFGIANYSDQYLLKAQTKVGERIGNYEFSAPEQATKDILPCETMDIYALGQICQWFVFGSTHKGTGRELFTSVFNNKSASLLDEIVDICIRNASSSRFKSIKEIFTFINKYKEKISKKNEDPFDDMYTFNEILRASFPESYDTMFYTSDINRIKLLINNIETSEISKKLYFNTGRSNNLISRLKLSNELILSDKNEVEIKNNIFLINQSEFSLKGIWVYCSSNVYDDYLIFEVESLNEIKIDNKMYQSYCIVNNNKIINSTLAESGYFINNGISEEIINFDYRFRDKITGTSMKKYYFVAPKFNNFMFWDNDEKLYKIQSSNLTQKILQKLHDEIYYIRHPEVAWRI
ncbi:protein kinase domain-containing protein [Cetobacterium sp.]|uniref:protein kinase domain-containing protein n=1 Tax=Cetobacterium sp. TaxID=2071632 RepID=UPI003F3D7E24